MTLQAALWVFLPICLCVGSAVLAVYIMQQRMEVQLARERQSLGEARAAIESQKGVLDELNRLREEAAQSQSLEAFMQGLHTEQRRFIRDQKMLFANRKCLVVQERLYFRSIPLCSWVEHEATVDEGANVDELARSLSVFHSLETQFTETTPDQPIESDDVVKLASSSLTPS
jgi:hypothetical protein